MNIVSARRGTAVHVVSVDVPCIRLFPRPKIGPAMRDQDLEADGGIALDLPHTKSLWLREAPYAVLLFLTLAGVAYWSFANAPINAYWMFLAVLSAVVCILTGWPRARDRDVRVRLLWTQALHWLTVLLGMNVLLLPNVAEMANADSTGQGILLVLAVGCLLAGIHIPSWQLGFLGVVMMICVPALAWLEESALLIMLAAVALVAVGAAVWWRIHLWRTSRTLDEAY